MSACLPEPKTIPADLSRLAAEIRGRSFEVAKRVIVSKVGSVRSHERFQDDVADAVFLRLQRNTQVGQYHIYSYNF